MGKGFGVIWLRAVAFGCIGSGAVLDATGGADGAGWELGLSVGGDLD